LGKNNFDPTIKNCGRMACMINSVNLDKINEWFS